LTSGRYPKSSYSGNRFADELISVGLAAKVHIGKLVSGKRPEDQHFTAKIQSDPNVCFCQFIFSKFRRLTEIQGGRCSSEELEMWK